MGNGLMGCTCCVGLMQCTIVHGILLHVMCLANLIPVHGGECGLAVHVQVQKVPDLYLALLVAGQGAADFSDLDKSRAGHLRYFQINRLISIQNHKCPALKIAFFWARA